MKHLTRLASYVLLFAALGFSFTSCTKTIVETKEVNVHDTTHVHDTTRGPTLMRFISMLPDGHPVFLKLSPEAGAPIFLSVPAGSSPQYIVVPDSGIEYYLFLTIDKCYDSVAIPILTPNSIHTCALFKDTNTTKFGIADDSAKLDLAPPGKCYIRFVDGIAQLPPGGPQLYLDLDQLGQSPFQVNSQAEPVQYGTINSYTLVPSGTHKIIVRNDQQEALSTMQNLQSGAYYTVRAYGDYPSTIKLAVDQD
jgi:hypothetical protein